jgi:hypothetical protein
VVECLQLQAGEFPQLRKSSRLIRAAFLSPTLPPMETDPIPSIVAAIARGRGRRGWKDPAVWIRFRAQLLSALALGHPLVWLDGVRELPADEVTRLTGEACDAVLRGGGDSPEADVVCAPTWRRWCRYSHGAACARMRRLTAGGAESST